MRKAFAETFGETFGAAFGTGLGALAILAVFYGIRELLQVVELIYRISIPDQEEAKLN